MNAALISLGLALALLVYYLAVRLHNNAVEQDQEAMITAARAATDRQQWASLDY